MDELLLKLEEMLNKYNGTFGINEWVYTEKFQIYIRVTKHLINENVFPTIDISNVSVYEEYQRQGIFKAILNTVENLAQQHQKIVYVESIQSEHLEAFLARQGYTFFGSHYCPNAYKNINSLQK